MTTQELSHLLDLRRQLADSLNLLASLETNAAPRSEPYDPVGDHTSEIADLRERIGTLKDEISRVETVTAAYIQTIEDDRTRIIFRLRFIHGKPWKEVAALIGGWSTANSVKLICRRYIAREGLAQVGRFPKKRD